MKFALINGERQEAQPNLLGTCPSCERPMTAKCGEVKVWHWAHRGKRECDPWWENETEWHRAWKNEFPVNWQEILQFAEDGEKHIADVKTDQGWVIEFQHSRIRPEERRSRDNFYAKLVWVVDGTRLKRDKSQFRLAWQRGKPVRNTFETKAVFLGQCAILKEWSASDASVFLDFGVPHFLLWLQSHSLDGTMNVVAFPRNEFIKIHHGSSAIAKSFDDLIEPPDRQAEASMQHAQVSSPTQRKPAERQLVPRYRSRRL